MRGDLQRSPPRQGFPQDLIRTTKRKLEMLDAATQLDDLKFPPGNRLHELKDDRKGQHATSVNDQFRLCFTWTALGPTGVEFTDCH